MLDMNRMIEIIKKNQDFKKVGMILCHNGVVRGYSKDGKKVKGLKVKLDKVKLSQTDRLYVNKAISFMKSNNSEHFFLSSLLPGKECSPKDIEIIINLIEKNIFQIF